MVEAFSLQVFRELFRLDLNKPLRPIDGKQVCARLLYRHRGAGGIRIRLRNDAIQQRSPVPLVKACYSFRVPRNMLAGKCLVNVERYSGRAPGLYSERLRHEETIVRKGLSGDNKKTENN